MNRLMEQLRALYQKQRAAHADLDQANFSAVETLLGSDVQTAVGFKTLTLALEQAFGYMYLRKPEAHFNGSLEERIEVICYELREAGIAGTNGFLVSVFPDYVIACEPGDYAYPYDMEPKYWKIAYTASDDNATVTFGDKQPVDLQMIAVPVAAEETAEQSSTTVDGTVAIPITDGGGELTVGTQNVTQDVTGSGAAGDAAVSAASQEANLSSTEAMPEWFLQGQDPPGGEEDLISTLSGVLLQDQGTDEKTGVMKVTGVATTADVVNTNRQVYPLAVWQSNMPRLNRLLQEGRLVGESEHPSDNRASLQRTCMKFTGLEWKDKELHFQAEILPTTYGKDLMVLIQSGVAVDISSRGQGTTKTGEWNGTPGVAVVQQGFRADAFDAVVKGASPGSTINEWMAQSSETAANTDGTASSEEEEMTKEQAAQLDRMAALADKMEGFMAAQAQNQSAAAAAVKTEETETKTETENKDGVQNQSAVDAVNAALTGIAQRAEGALNVIERSAVSHQIENLVTQAMGTEKWPVAWFNTYRKQLSGAQCQSLADLAQADERIKATISQMVEDAPKYPGSGHIIQADKGKRGPQTPREALDALCDGIPDELPDDGSKWFRQQDENGEQIVPSFVQTPRRRLRQWLENIAHYQDQQWNGPAALKGLTMMMQGHTAGEAQDWMNQTCGTGVTSIADGGAPQANIFIFPLIRRVFPMLIAQELASVQPINKPDAKIFFLDAVRVSPPGYTDEAGTPVSSRFPINRTDSLSDSYSNDPGECATSQKIQLKLSAKSVSAQTKKLHSEWTYEQMQDLRAYHGLDTAVELSGFMAKEIAMEWNEIVLAELLSGATAGNFNFGTTAPSGYTQKEWDEYITRYIDAAGTKVFENRSGEFTHIIAGPQAWLKLSATHRSGTVPNVGDPEMYPGLVLTPFMSVNSPNVRCFKTNFWRGANTDKILVLRKGSDWSDTPYVFAPYIDVMTPIVTNAQQFSQSQGIMSRSAHKVVVGDAIATVTIQEGVTGARV
jgi:hypothetical protein